MTAGTAYPWAHRQMTNVAAAKAGYIEVYTQVGIIAIAIAVLMLLISPVISKMMHGAD